MASDKTRKFLVVGTLYVSQAVPLGFFTVAVPAILRSQGVRLEIVGLVGALALPWLLKFLWAPLVDGFGSRGFGHYRSWIVPLQLASIACVAAIAFFEPGGNLVPLLLAGAAFMVFSATQDTATDGLAVRMLGPDERGTGNGVQVGGYYLGQILGGGAVLLLFGRFGWMPALLAMAAFLSLPLFPLVGFREPEAPAGALRQRPGFGSIGRFFSQQGIGVWVTVLVLYRAGEQMAVTMLNPMLVDYGYSLEQIGLLLGLIVSAGALGGSITGGGLVNRVGRKYSLVSFGFLQSACLGLFVFPALGYGGAPLVWAVVGISAFTGGMATAALYTNMMDRCSERTAGTDFAVQQALCAVGPMLGAAVSGFSASAFGYAGHFVLAAGVGLVTLIVIVRWLIVSEPVTADVAAAEPRQA